MPGMGAKAGGGSGAVRAGRAFIELFAQDNKLYRSLDQAQARLKKFGAFSAKIGLAASAGGGAVLAPMTKFFTDAVSRGAKIDQLAKRFGLTTESVSELAYAFDKGGVSLGEFEGVLGGLSSRIIAAADANTDVIDGLASFRTNGRQLLAMPLDQALDRIADAFTHISKAQDQASQAEGIFGGAGLGMLEVLKKGSAGLAAWKKEAGERGAVLNQEDATRATVAMRAYTDTMLAAKLAIGEIGRALVGGSDGVKQLSDRIIAAIQVGREWIAANRDVIVTIAKVAVGVSAVGAALVALAPVFVGAAAAIGVLVAVVKLAAAALLAVLSPVGLVVAAVVGLGYAFSKQESSGRGMLASLKAGFADLATIATTAWGGIAAALESGNVKGAIEIAVAGIKAAWAQGMVFLTEKWMWFENNILSGLRKIGDTISDVFGRIKQAIGTEGVGDTAARLAGGYATARYLAPRALRAVGMGSRFLGPVGLGLGLAATAIPWERLFGSGEKKGEESGSNPVEERRSAARAAADELEKVTRRVGLASAEAADAAARAHALEHAKTGQASGSGPGGMKLPQLPGQQELFNAVKGTFALPMARQQLEFGDNAAKRQLDAAERVAKNTDVLPATKEAIEKMHRDFSFK